MACLGDEESDAQDPLSKSKSKSDFGELPSRVRANSFTVKD